MLSIMTMRDNILDTLDRATADERAYGAVWYGEARDFSERLATRYGLTVDAAAAVVATLSPQTEWGHNKRWAERVCFAHAVGLPLPQQGLGNNLRRAAIALSGDLSDVERTKGTLKVNRFWRCILGRPGVATVDRHALRVAFGDPFAEVPSLTDKRYLDTERAYILAGRSARMSARNVQAATWLVCRRERGLAA